MRLLALMLAAAAVCTLVFLLRHPVRTTGIRIAILLTSLFPGTVAVLLSWRWKHAGKVLLVPVLAGGVLALSTLRLAAPAPESFVAALERYEGTPYVWGGETGRGIDCSGLIRVALRDSLAAEGRLGASCWIWWSDAAARDFGVAYADLLEPAGEAPSLRSLESNRPPPGSVAVTRNGVHVLAHLGGGRWIQASPEQGRVIVRPAMAPDPWHDLPVRIYRLR